MLKKSIVLHLLEIAAAEASKYRGATDPNPPVGAVAVDSGGKILAIDAHRFAGGPHAEELVITQCLSKGVLNRLHALIVTLEPCNHYGKTGPCTKTVLGTKIEEVHIGSKDPNNHVFGGGAEFLKEKGLSVSFYPEAKQCESLIKPFSTWLKQDRPYITIKRALTENGSMIPPVGQKTFTSSTSLIFAHQLRKRSKAVLTGSETVLKDDPAFTVRHVSDHKKIKRYLVVLDRRKRIEGSWVEKSKTSGFEVMLKSSAKNALKELKNNGVLEVLVEAGPSVSGYLLENDLWDEEIIIRKGSPDSIEYRFRNSQI